MIGNDGYLGYIKEAFVSKLEGCIVVLANLDFRVVLDGAYTRLDWGYNDLPYTILVTFH
jgi:hypothetical protein